MQPLKTKQTKKNMLIILSVKLACTCVPMSAGQVYISINPEQTDSKLLTVDGLAKSVNLAPR